MNILIATDGGLDPQTAAQTAARLAGEDGSVSIVTVIEVPRTLLADLRNAYNAVTPAPPIDQDAEYVGIKPSVGGEAPPHWPGDDQFVDRYIADQTDARIADLSDALRGLGVDPTVVSRESEDAAASILALAEEMTADVLIIGSHGLGRFEGLLGSISTKLARRASCSVLILR